MEPGSQLSAEYPAKIRDNKVAEIADISHLSMSEALTGSLEEFAPDITPIDLPDISKLSMSEAQHGSLEGIEKKPEPAAIPDTSHLIMFDKSLTA